MIVQPCWKEEAREGGAKQGDMGVRVHAVNELDDAINHGLTHPNLTFARFDVLDKISKLFIQAEMGYVDKVPKLRSKTNR